LDLPEPQIISRPFSHLKEAINTIADFTVDDRRDDLTKETKKWIDIAIKGFEEGKGFKHIEDAQKSKISEDEMIRKTRDIWVYSRFNQIDAIFEHVRSSKMIEAKNYLAFALYNRGIVLLNLARMKKGKEAEELLKQSFEKYEKALKIKPDLPEALSNWGTALLDLAKMKKGRKAEELFKQSCEKYEKALKIKPDDHEALNNWGTALSYLARMKKGKEAEELFRRSLSKFMSVEEIKKGAAAYSITCVYSLMGEVKKSLTWMEKALKMESVLPRDHVLEDGDLDNIKSTDTFRRLLNKYRPE